MDIPPQVYELVERFDRHLDDYKRGKYNETQVRREFIDPLFRALGWDIDNTQGYAETYKEVVHEDAIKIGQATKAPDYSFRIGGVRKFFLEAKKPSVDIKHDTHPAYQLRRYAWSAKLPLSILTDFEEFAVYDCRIKPDKADQAAAARVMYLRYTDYLDQWPVLVDIFSPESIKKGSFDKYVESKAVKRGTAEVDTAFLQEIERWRDVLARNLALRNRLTPRQLNYAVQQTIDRIIFLRIAEDRGIEPYGQLRELAQADAVYPRLFNLFARADARYNSGLFHFDSEKGRPDPDTFTPTLTLDDKVLKDIFKNLYYPDSPYEFSVLPADILGQVYEQFLGKVIRLTAGGQAKVEDKPEVKKAGGVYYTPTYIVEYIVRQTVGKLVEGQTPADIGGAPARATGRPPLRILDPACGSGSFLLGAYQFLLNWYLNWYLKNDPGKWAKKKNSPIYPALTLNPQTPNWKLTVDERKRILLTHIYGVDIDPQAVEVTKLSLLLKVLEDEQSVAQQLGLFQERVLPDLDHNIKCGNSLIGPDFYQSDQLALFDEEESYRINAFDWQKEFPQVFAGETLTPSPPCGRPKGRGESLLPLPLGEGWGEGHTAGFDAVIGNPPYIRIQAMKEWAPKEVEFYKQRYVSASKGNYDIYVVFVEKGLSLLNDRGRLGFILPHKFFNAQYGEALRGLIAKGKHLSDIIHFGDQQIFANATTYTCLLFLDKQGRDSFHIMKADNLTAWRQGEAQTEGDISAAQVTPSEWNFTVGSGSALFARLSQMPVKLGDVAHLFVGLQTDADDVYILEVVSVEGEQILCKSKATSKIHPFENIHLKRFLKGSVNIRRYFLSDLTKRLIFPYQTIGDKSILISASDYERQFPLTWEYLKQNRARLAARNKGQMSGPEWYGYVYRKNHTRLDSPKLLAPSLAMGATFATDLDGEFFFVGSGGGGGGGYGISLLSDTNISSFYLLGLLNSTLSTFFLRAISTPFRGGYIALNRQYIQQLPIRTINFSDPADRACHDRMVSLVEQMLKLNQQLAQAQTPQDKTMLKRQVEVTDSQIDKLVYELYNLTEEEIKIVAEKAG